MSRLIATFLGAGLAPFAPGTFGSLAALPFWVVLTLLGGWPLVVAASIVAFGLGLWATGVETAGAADHDPSMIVIDEVVGQWIALLPLSALAASGLSVTLLAYILAGFTLFRLFDITKIWPVSWADNMSTPMGVMLDDVLAGGLAALCLWGLYVLTGAP